MELLNKKLDLVFWILFWWKVNSLDLIHNQILWYVSYISFISDKNLFAKFKIASSSLCTNWLVVSILLDCIQHCQSFCRTNWLFELAIGYLYCIGFSILHKTSSLEIEWLWWQVTQLITVNCEKILTECFNRKTKVGTVGRQSTKAYHLVLLQ